jgi:hypothetical protein
MWRPGRSVRSWATVNDPAALRCSDFARAARLDPVGTAGSYAGFAVVEVPLPWPREITDHPDLAAAAPALAAARMRAQAVVPDPSGAPAGRRLLSFLAPPGAFDRYRGAAWDVPADGVAGALAALAGQAAAGGGESEAAGPARRRSPGTDAERHVLVCTHGRRDACCGTLGTRLTLALPGLGAATRVWRTSHTGGHRFAPTAVLLPEGTAWAYLDVDTLAGIADRTLDVDVAARHYRGCAGLGAPEVQAAEREALRAIGWSWLDHRRTGSVLGPDGAGTRVRLDAVAPDGRRLAFEARVEIARVLPVPDCGLPPEQAAKSAPELRVAGFAAA